jgi:hypothetical protein
LRGALFAPKQSLFCGVGIASPPPAARNDKCDIVNLLRLETKTVILSLSKDDGSAKSAPFDGLRVLRAFCCWRFRYQGE